MANQVDQRFLDMINEPHPNFWNQLYRRHGITNFEDARVLAEKFRSDGRVEQKRQLPTIMGVKRWKFVSGAIAAMAIAFFSGVALADADQSSEGKPVEQQTGNLDFTGVSDRNLNEFIAENLYQLNTRMGSVEFHLLTAMVRNGAINRDQYLDLSKTSMMRTQATARTVKIWIPDIPGADEARVKLLDPKIFDDKR